MKKTKYQKVKTPMPTSAYQHNYYLANRDKLRAKHREYSREYRRKIKLGLIIPRQKEIRHYGELRVDDKCSICRDTIEGRRKIAVVDGAKYKVDCGCYDWWQDRNYKLRVKI